MRKIVLIFLMFASCINPYQLDQQESASPLVVEGYISNRAGDSEVKLSYGGDFQRTVFERISNAEVVIFENETIEHKFAYAENGSYIPVKEDFYAKEESSYHLKIVLEGQEYESDQVSLQNSLDIDSLSFQPVAVNKDGDMIENIGLEILLTSSDDELASRYYIYTFEETWEVIAGNSHNQIITPFFITDENRTPINIDFRTEFVENMYCWSTNKVVGLVTLSTEGLSRNQFINVPLFRVNLESTRLLYKYSVLVNQYSISQGAHHFFNMLKEFSESSGFLYDIQPGYVEGNIHNRNEPEDKVIGIFYAASHTSSRVFISNSDIPFEAKSIVRRYQPSCENIRYLFDVPSPDSIPNDDFTNSLQFLRDSLLQGTGLVVSNFYFRQDSVMEVELTNTTCADCRVYGSNVKPDWWE